MRGDDDDDNGGGGGGNRSSIYEESGGDKSKKAERIKVVETEDCSRGPLSGCIRLADSSRVIQRLKVSEILYFFPPSDKMVMRFDVFFIDFPETERKLGIVYFFKLCNNRRINTFPFYEIFTCMKIFLQFFSS